MGVLRKRPPQGGRFLFWRRLVRAAGLPCAAVLWLGAISGSRTASAAEALFLGWNDCPLSATSSSSATFACDLDVTWHDLVCSFTLAQPVDSVIGAEIVVDLQTEGATLPQWWHDEVGGCRDGMLTADGADLLSACADLWQGTTSGGLLSYTPGMPRGGANQARMRLALAVPLEQARSLDGVSQYYAARIVLSHGRTVGPPSCAGCGVGACLVLNSILLRRPPRPPGTPSSDVLLQIPGSGQANWVTWQTGTLGACQAVPVRNRTWGALKSLYR